jgi:NAD(P)-dependent dehydrogenase (short-subunit alcohol dehydrogenase family)
MNPQIWLITGISSGLGQSIAHAAMQKGHFVIGTLRQKEQVLAFNKIHKNKGFALKMDITKPQDVQKVVQTVQQKWGRLDVLVNNAGIGFTGAVEEASMAEVRGVFEANFFGTLQLTQLVLPMMRAQKSGHIVQMSSHGGVKAFPGFGIYNASKFALEGFSEAMAAEVAALGIKVTIVEPGPFRTKFADAALRTTAKTIEDYTTTAGAFHKRMKEVVNGNQEGDPDKAAAAIVNMVAAENPPLRMPLGKTALMTMGMKVESVRADLERGKAIAESVVYE